MGPFGIWQSVEFCPTGQVIIGFALRSESNQGKGDDTAADNFAAYCGDPLGSRTSSARIQGKAVSSTNNEYTL